MKIFSRAAWFSAFALSLLLLGGAGPVWAKHKQPVAVDEDYALGEGATATDDTSSAAGSTSNGTITLNSGASFSTFANTVPLTSAAINSYGGGTLTGSAGMINHAGVTTILNTGAPTMANSLKYPVLSGSAGKLKITTSADGNLLRVKTVVAISNMGTKVAKNVTATVYLSDDAVLDAADTKLTVLNLSDYTAGVTKLHKGETLNLPIKRKVPMAVASFLEGKYLIAVLESDAVSATLNASPVVYVSSGGSTVGLLPTTTGGLITSGNNGTAPATTVLPATPKNQVIIGPIKLP